jgi:hypothetical protein
MEINSYLKDNIGYLSESEIDRILKIIFEVLVTEASRKKLESLVTSPSSLPDNSEDIKEIDAKRQTCIKH